MGVNCQLPPKLFDTYTPCLPTVNTRSGRSFEWASLVTNGNSGLPGVKPVVASCQVLPQLSVLEISPLYPLPSILSGSRLCHKTSKPSPPSPYRYLLWGDAISPFGEYRVPLSCIP